MMHLERPPPHGEGAIRNAPPIIGHSAFNSRATCRVMEVLQ